MADFLFIWQEKLRAFGHNQIFQGLLGDLEIDQGDFVEDLWGKFGIG